MLTEGELRKRWEAYDRASRDTWLGASTALGRLVSIDEQYPHICGQAIPRLETQSQTRDVLLGRWQCGACAEQRFRRWSWHLCRIASALHVLAALITDLHRDLCHLTAPEAREAEEMARTTAVFIGQIADDLDSRGRKGQPP
ncbi:hypothetical protein [Actinoplanes xinjiangensis]|uniref:hypothetical protein n=1 Tax=Actinoplanes xinjiangensis TaxID=512350 RepID=UPI00341FA5E6